VPRDVTLRSGAAKLMPEPACRVSRRSVPQFTSPKPRTIDGLTPNAAAPAMGPGHRQRRSRAPTPGRNEMERSFECVSSRRASTRSGRASERDV